MADRTVEDRLREEYFSVLPEVQRVAEELEATVRYRLLGVSGRLDRYEQIVISARIEDCESAVDALRRHQESATFDPERAESYTLTALNDLAGVRVNVFPRSRWIEAHQELREHFPLWTYDPVTGDGETGEPVAFKYHGHCSASSRVRAEFQVVPLLIGDSIGKSSIRSFISRLRNSRALLANRPFSSETEKYYRRSGHSKMSLRD